MLDFVCCLSCRHSPPCYETRASTPTRMAHAWPVFIAFAFSIVAFEKPHRYHCYANTEETHNVKTEDQNDVYWVIEEIWTMRPPTSFQDTTGGLHTSVAQEQNHGDDSYGATGETPYEEQATTVPSVDILIRVDDNSATASSLSSKLAILCLLTALMHLRDWSFVYVMHC